MTTTDKTTTITVATTVNASIEKVWAFWTKPEHIVNWNSASPDWHSPKAENDLREGGRFTYRMEARDGTMGFDFGGEYTKVSPHEEIAYRMDDDRKVTITFTSDGDKTVVTETFEAEGTHADEMQRTGWQAILENFKQYTESSGKMERIHFEITIEAPAEKVYNTMLDQQGYRDWTTEFNPSSYYEGTWEEGSKMAFIGTNKEGKKLGMVSRIKENKRNQFVSIEHIGMLDGDQEVTSGPTIESWAGAMENYTFREEDGQTILSIDMDSQKEHKTYFEQTWPKALQKLKAICEK